MAPKPLVCNPCKRRTKRRIKCRGCGRLMCKHFARSVTDKDGRQFDPLRDPDPGQLLGTCTSCAVKSAQGS